MSTIKILDDRLNSFYEQNPDFDILQFNLLNGQTNNLNWENLERETSLELLKKYQRLLRINSDLEIANKLLNEPSQSASLDSAHVIASMTEEQFVKILPGDEVAARQMHKKAIDIKAKTQLLWANIKDAVASPYFRSMRTSISSESDRATLEQNIPSYQEMFGDLDYIDCDPCNSIFSPAAYFVDLMRIVDQHITAPHQESIRQAGNLTLNQRRPDLADIELSCDNTNSLVPTLEIINRILLARVKSDLGSADGMESLASTTYPFNLPFNFPLAQVRSYLGQLQTDLATIYETFNVEELAVSREYIGLSYSEYDLIVTPQRNSVELSKLYGVDNISTIDLGGLVNVEVFLEQTGISRTELRELLEQNLDQAELDAGVPRNFYINQALGNNLFVKFKSDDFNLIDNLNPATLDRINRFIRLAKKLNWSFTDLDWVLTSINANEIDPVAIIKIAEIKKFQAKYKLPLDVLCSFWHEMKTIGVGDNSDRPEDLFDRVFNNPFRKTAVDNQFFRLQDELGQIQLSNLEQEAETNKSIGRILAALKLNLDQFINIAQAIWGQENTIELTVANLSQLFRTKQILKLLRLNIDEYQLLLSLIGITDIGSISLIQFQEITILATWVKESKLKIDELNYIITGNLSPQLSIGRSASDLTEGMKSLWQLGVDSLIQPTDFIHESIDEEQALLIFDRLVTNNYIAEITSNYANVINPNFNQRIAIVLDSEITNDRQLIQEIFNAENSLEETQNNNLIQHLQAILNQGIEQQQQQVREIISVVNLEADLVQGLLDFTGVALETPNYLKLLLTPVLETEAEWSQIVTIFQFLPRIQLLTKKLKLTPTELKAIADNQTVFGITELSQLSINNIQNIQSFKKLVHGFNDNGDRLVKYLKSVTENNADNYIEDLAEITGWKSEQITLLVSPTAPINIANNAHQTVAGIEQLKHCFDLSNQLGVNISWFSILITNLETVTDNTINWESYQNAAQAVREIVQAKYSYEEWLKVREKLDGELNEHQRDALTAWILSRNDYENLRHLSQELLIDVESSSYLSVSLIKEAILAIQTYLHRCRMGLEMGVNELNIPENWWQWMMNYRVWEANRKVFLYPENYLNPSLRKIKSPIYQELETELLQSEITQESVTKAYENYFEKFAEIAQLKPAGGYHCTVETDSGAQDTLYLFGRTTTEPHTYYYRQCINPQTNKPTWKAWQKIDLVINSPYINATYAFNKLFIFWVEIVQIEATKQKGNNQEVETETKTKASIKYSFQKFGKQWIQPQILAKDIAIDQQDIGNLWRKVTALPISSNGTEPEKILTLFGNLVQKNESYVTQNQKQGISLTIDLLQENTKVVLENQSSNSFQGILPVISANRQLKAIATNNVLYDNYAEYVDDSTRGLVAYWSMDEERGNVIRDRIGNKNGTLQGNPPRETVNDFPNAESRNVLEFDGEDDYIDCGNIDFARDNYTITAWFKTSATSTGDILSATNSNKHGILIEVGSNGTLRYLHRQPLDTEGGTELRTSENYNDGQWHQVAAIKNSTKMLLYVDGSLKKETSSPTNFSDPFNVVIGKIDANTSGRFFQGQIAEVSIWDVALSAEQIFNPSIPLIPLITENISGLHVLLRGIDNQPGWFTFDNGNEAFLAIPQGATDFPQIEDALQVVAEDNQIKLSYDATDLADLSELNFSFNRLSSTTIRQLSQKMSIAGIDRLLTLDSQLTPELSFNRFATSDFVIAPDKRQLDFDGALGIYFWEIFFHIPFLVANTLNSNQRFEEAQKWYHYIFNPTNPTEFNQSGLLSYWSIINEGSGTEIRDRIGSNNGTLQGNPQWKTVTDFPGVSSRNVLKFDGEDDYVQIANESNFDSITSSATIEAWIKLDSSAASQQSIVIKGREFRLDVLGDNKLHFYVDSGGFVNSTANVNDGEWHHVAAVYDRASLQLYVDGVLDSQKPAFGSALKNDEPILIGGNGKSGFSARYFNGQIAEVSIWNVALSANQILLNSSILPSSRMGNSSERFWRFLPFRGNILQKLEDFLNDDQGIATYKDHPFDPYGIADLRIGAYEKAIAMKYIDNLLDWGDRLFTQDNRESINQATLLYFLAYDLLGERPENLGVRRSLPPKTFAQIQEQSQSDLGEIPQFLIDLENRLDKTTPSAISTTPFNELNSYFCAPENEQFTAYWERVEDRLYKIRYSLSIEGIRRQLALFQPAIDPAQLVRAVAGGRTPLSVVSQLNPAIPNYRFDYILERSRNLTSTLIQLGSSLLSALEKKDAEELALLRSSHEISILKLITTIKEKQVEEAKETLASFEESKKSAEKRRDYYSQWIEDGLIAKEKAHLVMMAIAQAFNIAAGGLRTAASIGYAVPQVGSPFAMVYGGKQLGAVLSSTAGATEVASSTSTFIAQVSQTLASYERREDEWELQRDVLEIDIEQIQHQIEAQKIRQGIAEQDLKTHNQSVEQAQEIEEFLQDKFTNQELYQWMVDRLSILYFQTYKIALDLAMASQSAYQYELNKNDTYINFNYWDSLKKGLLAGESLMLGINQLETAYLEENIRRLEIEKTISLLQLDPLAFYQLKTTGKCNFEFSEQLFDSDFPGHYARQVKTMAISIPAVIGPYQNINATLTQTSNKTLIEPDLGAVEYLLGESEDAPDTSILRSDWRRNQKIAISRGAMDNGLFELSFFWDTRYLPFEGTGTVSTWELSLPKANNRIDFDTISDVIITLSYTALDGGDKFRQDVTNLELLKQYSEAYYLNLKQAFPGEWHTFMNSTTDANSQKLNFPISEEIISPHIDDAKLTGIIFKLDDTSGASLMSFATINIGENKIINSDDDSINERVADNWFGNWVINFDLTKVPESLKKDGFLNAETVNNIELILIYEGKIS